MDEESGPDNVYEAALLALAQGAMPVIVPMEDGLHIVSLCATSQRTLSFMVNDDAQVRLRFVTQAVISVRENIES